jgi:hypothetical protein
MHRLIIRSGIRSGTRSGTRPGTCAGNCPGTCSSLRFSLGCLLWLAAVSACSTTTSPSPGNSSAGNSSRPAGRDPRGPRNPGRAAPARRSPSLLANGDFSAGLAHWELSGKGAVVDDPEQPGNPVLRIQRIEALFGLSHAFTVPDGTERLTVHLRVMATAATEAEPIGLRLRFYDQDGNSAFTMWTIARSGTWIEITETISDLPPRPVSLGLENNRGAGDLLIDDLTLQPAP